MDDDDDGDGNGALLIFHFLLCHECDVSIYAFSAHVHEYVHLLYGFYHGNDDVSV